MKFEEYYQNLFQDRWPSLLDGLKSSSQKTALRCNPETEAYELDVASLAPIEFLPVNKHMRVLDLCAAPGGKSLALLKKLEGQVDLVASDLSSSRVSRLKKVLLEHTPSQWHKNIHVLCKDGNQFGLREKDSYDAAILDAPCSSERHVLNSAKELSQWSVKRMRGLKVRQHSLLCSALAAVRSGGFIVYSTCALVSEENDGVIERLHESREGQFEVVPISAEQKQQFESDHQLKIEETQYGYQILPWKNPQTHEAPGPLYWCVLRKL